MSSIAQRLCDEICDKPTKPSKQNIQESYKKLNYASSSRYSGRPTRSIVVEKKRVINDVIPNDISSKSKIINKFKSKETLLKKKFVDTGLNTIITGPLRCDNNCVTMVRKRDPKASCKCNFKSLNNMSTKEMQTFNIKNYSHLDKACTQCIETTNCGTQFFERLSSRNRTPMNRSKVRLCNEVYTQTYTTTNNDNFLNIESSRMDDLRNRSNTYNYMGARRWALSHYPTRGPDF